MLPQVLHEVTVELLSGLSLVWKPKWGWKICVQDGSFMTLLAFASVPYHVDLMTFSWLPPEKMTQKRDSDQLERSLTISSWKWHTINSSYSIGHTNQFWYKVGGCYTRLWLSEYEIIWGLSWRLPIILSPYLIYASSINCGSEITQKYVSFCSNSQGYFFILHFSFWVIVWQPGPVLQISSFSNQFFYYILFFIMKYQTIFLVIQSSYLKPSNSFP